MDSCFAFGEFLHITLKDNQASGIDLLNRIALENKHTNIRVKEIEPGIEDSFILLMSQDTASPNHSGDATKK